MCVKDLNIKNASLDRNLPVKDGKKHTNTQASKRNFLTAHNAGKLYAHTHTPARENRINAVGHTQEVKGNPREEKQNHQEIQTKVSERQTKCTGDDRPIKMINWCTGGNRTINEEAKEELLALKSTKQCL